MPGFLSGSLDTGALGGISKGRNGTGWVLFPSGGCRVIRLSRVADYGIVLMTELARTGASKATPELAERTRIAQPMAGKILKALAREGLLTSQRGAKGGYQLARPASLITVAEVIEALDGPIALTACIEVGEGECGIEAICPARANWHRINAAMREALDGISIAEMAQGWALGRGGLPFGEPATPATAPTVK
ncbi:MAG: SUF system Fe-S cluster assembly regulator [Pseudomonadota bacterium]